MALKPHIARWWDIANDRRQCLIVKKHKGGGLTDGQEHELEMLQKVADAVVDYASPPNLPRGIKTAARLAIAVANHYRADKDAQK